MKKEVEDGNASSEKGIPRLEKIIEEFDKVFKCTHKLDKGFYVCRTEYHEDYDKLRRPFGHKPTKPGQTHLIFFASKAYYPCKTPFKN